MTRIAFLLNNDFQFDSRVQREAQALNKAGHAVTVFCTQDKQKKLPPQSEKEGVQIRRTFRKQVHSFKPLTLRHLSGLVSILTGSYGQFDVVHAHDANMLLVGWILARAWGAKLVYDSHELWDSMYQFEREQTEKSALPAGKKRKTIQEIERTRQVERWLIKRAYALISVNNSLCRMLNETAKLPPELCVTLRNTSEYFASTDKPLPLLREYFNLRPETQVILYQGEIKSARGIEPLLSALELLPQADFALVLMGSIPNAAYAQQLHQRVAESKHLQGRVLFKERVQRNELLAWTASADLGIAPILNIRANNYYCLPNKLFEYLQAEVPCATSDFPELKAIVEGYDVGFTFNPEHLQTLADALTAFFQDPERAARYRKNARNAKHELSWEQEQRKLIALYDQL
jgi:glycosyltransferase involved in cell wall biosynthesis